MAKRYDPDPKRPGSYIESNEPDPLTGYACGCAILFILGLLCSIPFWVWLMGIHDTPR